jgi:hypothetical protein
MTNCVPRFSVPIAAQTFHGRDIKFVSMYLAATQTSDGCTYPIPDCLDIYVYRASAAALGRQ